MVPVKKQNLKKKKKNRNAVGIVFGVCFEWLQRTSLFHNLGFQSKQFFC